MPTPGLQAIFLRDWYSGKDDGSPVVAVALGCESQLNEPGPNAFISCTTCSIFVSYNPQDHSFYEVRTTPELLSPAA